MESRIAASSGENEQNLRTALTPWLSGVAVAFVVYGFVIAYGFTPEKSGPWGDSFGALTGLVTALAFCVAVYSARQQGRELALQRNELRLQREQLALQREDLKQSIKALQDQAKHAADQVDVDRKLLLQQRRAHLLAQKQYVFEHERARTDLLIARTEIVNRLGPVAAAPYVDELDKERARLLDDARTAAEHAIEFVDEVRSGS
jgi:hypothetical protein